MEHTSIKIDGGETFIPSSQVTKMVILAYKEGIEDAPKKNDSNLTSPSFMFETLLQYNVGQINSMIDTINKSRLHFYHEKYADDLIEVLVKFKRGRFS